MNGNADSPASSGRERSELLSPLALTLLRLLLVGPVLLALLNCGFVWLPATIALCAVWLLNTLLGQVRARRGALRREWAAGLLLLDIPTLFLPSLFCTNSLLAALPAYSIIGAILTLLYRRSGARLSVSGALLLAVIALAGRWPVLPPEQIGIIALWAVYHTTGLIFLNRFAEYHHRALFVLERRAQMLRVRAEHHAELALRDPLTGLHNRRFFEQRLQEEVARTQRFGTPLALGVIDIDFLKRWNDRWGHEAGDTAIITLAVLLQGACRTTDVVCRIGGEEFVLIAPETDADGLVVLLDRVREAASESVIAHPATGVPVDEPFSFSAGVADAAGQRADSGALFRAADQALYQAKSGGRNRVVRAAQPE